VTHSPAEFLRDAREMASHASTYSSLDAETLAGTKDARFSVVYPLIQAIDRLLPFVEQS
jgi:hypothetical protein